ncbi:structural maintenance of chromosomes protein 5 [Synchiropus splendidus]|uniref:structural maintenance of chromosomes protein 5 n=1 Tax=Synchiropus splendidus TaxID=270530 RepID=UPI00237E36BA|nr:structural maintenance of chromosomes protein 5 [Synchiropus splendidus]
MAKAKRKLCDVIASDSRREDEVEGFVPGAILRITMTNFLTYNYAVLRPGPNLNMIVGANGTGKSSVVCAICLGLAGKTSVLGRGDKVGLYVKRGFSKGSIEIELYKPRGRLVITREIQADNNQSQWKLNGKHCSQKAVEDEVKALQIQVSNLCQFLPQEKVGEFAKMSKIQLLEATEKSVGPPEMFQYHCELKKFRDTEKEMERHLKEKSAFLERLKQRNERNGHDVNRYYEKKRHLDLIQLLEKKKPWVEYETCRGEFEGVQKELKEAKRRLAALKLAQAPMLQKLQTIDGQLTSAATHLKEKAAAIKEASLHCKRKQDELDRKSQQIEDVKQMLILKQTEKEDQQKRVRNIRLTIKDLMDELTKASDRPDVTPKLNDVNDELRRIQKEKTKVEGGKLDLRREHTNICADGRLIKKKLLDMINLMAVKEERLRASHHDTHAAMMWLRQNQNLFSGRVSEPMVLSINVRDQKFAKYVEDYIPFRDLRAFVFQSKDDMNKFMIEVRDRMNLKVNAIAAPVESCAQLPPSRSIESLRHFGFWSYLREMFDAPEEVMSYLCRQHHVHEVPVGDDHTKAQIKTVVEQPYLKVLYTREERYVVKRSYYSGQISTCNSVVRPSQFLFITVDTEEKQRLELLLKDCESKLRDTEEQIKATQVETAALELQENKLLAEKKQLSEFKGKVKQLEQKIRIKQDSLEQMENSGIDLKKIEAEAKASISSAISDKVAVVTGLVAQMKLRAKFTMEKAKLVLEMVPLKAEKKKLQHHCREGSSELKNLEQKCQQLENQKMALRERSQVQLARARQVCHMSDKEPLSEELRNAFSKLPSTLDGIERSLSEEQACADCFAGLDENVVEEFNRRDREIKLLQTEVDEKVGSLTAYKESISQVKEQWLIPLKQLVEKISNKFSLFCRSMQCVGEVDLHSDNKEEYDKFGIRIRVKFHHGSELHELTAQHQSGGERSVATMLYLLALQELNRCPFRVVDEINQGMDPVNERRIFDIVVRTACQESTSQYFFITPKLLQNLPYADEMTVHCVYSGTNMIPAEEWDEKAFLYQRRHRRAT